MHATTLITNAFIEGKTGRAGLVTTSGFGFLNSYVNPANERLVAEHLARG